MNPDAQGDPARLAGRRSDSGRVLAWAPGFTGGDVAAAGGAAAASDRGEQDGADDGFADPPDQLGELDLAASPVSVTPPRTWRRAAWFAVGASCAVLIVLAFAASRLAGGPTDRIDALPGLPTGGLLTANPIGTPANPPAATTAPSGTTTGPGGGPAAGGEGTGGGDRPGATTGEGAPADSGGAGGTTAPGQDGTPPAVSYLPVDGHPPIAGPQLAEAAIQFYGLLPGDVDAAWELVGQKVKARGIDSFRKQWAGAADLQVQQLVVDADASTVVATIGVSATDGTASVQRYELVFRRGSTRVIEEINPIVQGGQKRAR